ncbi:hypothetical protein CWI37_0584p0010 [Hamiltosporidium tvaerminnensis]|uniref:Uncharacterized protein n=1 Tax=Hamiltosporidium tvaerminnensis TaxID=1176355 RepID=A0A4Q9L3B2_9MICR|nr:hypothetical protein CWI37_0584p0010 [Hamiltosporidium tvaerminnensis]
MIRAASLTFSDNYENKIILEYFHVDKRLYKNRNLNIKYHEEITENKQMNDL